MTEDGLRHAFIDLGNGSVLHPFEAAFIELPSSEQPMFQRGRLDHVALHASNEDAFWEARRRLRTETTELGDVIDMGMMLNYEFADPDGTKSEVVWITSPGIDHDQTLRANWTILDGR